MVTVVILSIIIGAVLLTNIRSMQSYYTLSALNELSNNAWFGLNELTDELRETKAGTLRLSLIQDPATGMWHNIVVFASARGNPASGNGNFHIDANGLPDWESAVIYYPFTTQDGINQLRRYIYYNSNLVENDFPLNAAVTAGTISITSQSGVSLAIIDRAQAAERTLVNHISTEDVNSNRLLDANENDREISLPMDNGDGQLDTGIDYSVNGNMVLIKLFLQKPVSEIAGATQRRVSLTLNSAAVMRN
jgi:hypothetical protein